MQQLKLQQMLDAAIRDENEAVTMYQGLADALQQHVNTLPPGQAKRILQNDVNQVRFVQSDEIRHRSIFQAIRTRV